MSLASADVGCNHATFVIIRAVASALRCVNMHIIYVLGSSGMLWEEEVRRSQGLSCGYGAVTGGLAEQLSTEGSRCAGTAEALWCGNS